MKIAYLTNQYPKVSHTFIRREIQALEDSGLTVGRYSIRGTPDVLADAADRAEQQRCRVVLAVGMLGLLWGVLRSVTRWPVRFIQALWLATLLGWGSERGVWIHFVYLAEACVLRNWWAKEGVEHVHVHFGTNPTAVALLCQALGGPGYSFTVHGPEEFDKPLSISLREKIERARFVVGISSFGRSQLYRHCSHAHWSKVQVVRCGVDASFLHAEPLPVPQVPRLVCVGRLCEQKGQLLLVEAVAQLASEGVELELVLVGDGEMRGEVEASIAQRGLQDRIHVTGWAAEAEVRKHIEQARALVLPSFAEGLPVVIMEALALGRPVLSTYVAGIPELVQPGVCGWLVPAGSVDALAAAMREVLDTGSDQLEAMGKEGRRRVELAHDVQANALRLRQLFEDYGSIRHPNGLPAPSGTMLPPST